MTSVFSETSPTKSKKVTEVAHCQGKLGCDLSDSCTHFRVAKEASNGDSGDPRTNLPLVETAKIRRKLVKILHVRLIFGVSFLLVILSSSLKRN